MCQSWKIYDKVSRQWFNVTKKEKTHHDTFTRSIRAKQQKAGCCRCSRSKIWLCDGCCDGCEFQTAPDGSKSLDYEYSGDGKPFTLKDILSAPLYLLSDDVIDHVISEKALNKVIAIYPEMLQIGHMRLNGMTYTEIAKRLGIKRTTLNSRIAKAKELLQEDFPELF